MNIQKSDCGYMGQWHQSVLSISFWNLWYNPDLQAKLGLAGIKGDFVVLDGHFWYRSLDWEAIREKVCTDPLFVRRFILYCRKTLDNALKASERFSTDSADGSLLERTRFFFATFRTITTPWIMISPIGEAVEKQLSAYASEKGIPLAELAHEVCVPEPTYLMKQQLDALRISALIDSKGLNGKSLPEIENDEEISRFLNAHISEFEWVGTHHLAGEPFTKEKLLEEIHRGIPAPSETRTSTHPPVKSASELSYLRLLCAEVSDIVAFRARLLLDQVTTAIGMDANWLSEDEILSALDGFKKHLSAIDIVSRKNLFGAVIENGKQKILTGAEVNALLGVMRPKQSSDITEVRGSVACRGIARGKVRLLIRNEDAKRFHEGEILVAPETTPDFVPAFKKARAVVTDRGGITSHAAVVSREFNIPCIIGTSIATQVFKDGDLVEVDAEKGIVRKITQK